MQGDNNARGGWKNRNESNRRVYSTCACAPTLTTCGGGGQEPKIMIIDEQNNKVRTDGIVGTLETDGSSPKHNNRVFDGYKIRKLTERECGRLMGLKNIDVDKIGAKLSRSAQYHCYGDSIVTTCLMAIFGEMLEVDYKQKINELISELKEIQE